MHASFKTAVSAVAFAIASMSGAQAAVISLDAYIGGANVFSFNDFKAPSADVEGAIMAGGNVDVSHYTTNDINKDAYGHYAMIAGGNLNYNGGNIYNGDIYVGGTATMTTGVQSEGYTLSGGAAPANMAQMATKLGTVSSGLTQLAATGTAEKLWSTLILTGSGSGSGGVEVINVDASLLVNSTSFEINNVSPSATLIVNFIGDSVGFHGDFQAFDAIDNVLFNTTSSNVTINNGFHVSLLAPNAAIKGGEGEVNGTIIVKSWDSTIQINGTNAFTAGVPGLVSAVPEPETYAMLLAGLGLMGFIARRRKQAAAR
jgi:choice-of-anchor A domain-containing protein